MLEEDIDGMQGEDSHDETRPSTGGVDQCVEEFQEGEVSTTLERVTSASVAVFYLKWSDEGVTGGTRGGVVRMYGPEGRHYFYSLQVP